MSKKEAVWVGHVYYPDGKVTEVEVTAPSGLKFTAMGKVQKAVGVTGPNDPTILGIKLQELGKTKVYKAGRKLGATKTDEEDADMSSFKRYRVSLFCSPNSQNYRTVNLRCANPYAALASAMNMYGIKKPEHVGPYIVEESDRDNGWTIRLAKQATAFNKDYKPGTTVTPPKAPAQPARVIPTKIAVYKSVAEAFAGEKKVVPRASYTVKRD